MPAPPSSPTPAAQRSGRSWLVLGVVALLGAAIGLGVFALPGYLAEQIDVKLRDMAARRGVTLTIGHVWLDPLSALTLDNVAVQDPVTGARLAHVDRVAVHYDINGVRHPKVFLREVTVTRPTMRLKREADGRLNIDALLRALQRRRRTGTANGSGGLRRFLSRHVPEVHVRGMSLRVDDEKGAPLKTPSGVDLRHLQFSDASFELRDTSPVQERISVRWSAQTRVAGFPGVVAARGTAELPERTGELHITLPKDFAIEARGLRAAVRGVSLWSDGKLEITGIQLAKQGANARLALAIKRLSTQVLRQPVDASEIPAEVRERLPSAALLALRHVRRLELHEPVVIGSRPEREVRQSDDDDDAGPPPSAKPNRRLLPKSTGRTDLEGKQSGRKRRRAKKVAASKGGKGSKGGTGAQKGRKSGAKGGKKGGKAGDSARPEPGEVVREALRNLLEQSADRMETQLTRVQRGLAAMPLEEIKVHHGSARFRGERAAAGLAQEVSDYSLVFKREGKQLLLALAFTVPGRKSKQQIQGRVDSATGDMQLKVQIDQLPLAPYAAVLPQRVFVHDNSAVHDTKLTVVVNRKDRTITVDGKAALSHLDVRAPRISRHLLADLNLRGKGRLTFDLARETVRLSKGELAVGKVVALIDGSVQRYRTAPAFDLHLKVPTIACQDIVDSLVPNVAPMLVGMSCHGTLSMRLNLGLDTANMRSLKLDYKPLLRKVEIDSLGKYIRFDVLDGPFEHHARQKDGTLYTFVTGPGTERWTPYEALPENMIKVVTTTEDGSFFWHKGFSLTQIRSAFVTNLLKGRFVRGASTISQQVVKNLFFVEFEKTLARKLQEAIITWQMERTLEKPKILELYFNIIEFGPKIYGIRAAASHYFNRPPIELTLLQSIWLGSIIPNPKAFYHQFARNKVKPSWQKYLCWIAGVMRKREKITPAEVARLGTCQVVFGGGPDGSERPEEPGLGYEGEIDADGNPIDPRALEQALPGSDDMPLPPPPSRPSAPRRNRAGVQPKRAATPKNSPFSAGKQAKRPRPKRQRAPTVSPFGDRKTAPSVPSDEQP